MRSHPLSPALCWALLGVLGLLSACASSPYMDKPTDPPFGQTVQRALQAQKLTPVPSAPAGVPFTELEPALERQQKAKPPETQQNRSGAYGSGLMGP